MSRLLYIRHAQASFMKADYDQLSDLGYEQSSILGKHLVQSELKFDKIYVGPLKRHWQTLSKVKESYEQAGHAFPEPIQLEDLKEHRGMEVMARVIPELVEKYDHVKKWADEAAANPKMKKKNQLRIFTWFMQEWASDRLDINHPEDLDTWAAFRAGASRAIETIIADQERGLTVAAFTSGGTIAASLGHVLEMEKEERVIELNGKVKNTSITQFLFFNGKVSLQSFNEVPHLTKKELVTYV